MSDLAVTWWGHSTATVELGGVRVGTDPIVADRLAHLRRYAPTPAPEALDVDVVLVSHLHADHLHVPSLRRLAPGVTLVVPAGAFDAVAGLRRAVAHLDVVEARPGEAYELGGPNGTVAVQVLAADHDERRHVVARRRAPALGFRVAGGGASFWYPGDTGESLAHADVSPVDLALVPVGGWGPSLGPEHLDPEQAAVAVARVGARWAVPVHYGTFWMRGLRRVHPASHDRLFAAPGPRFVEAVRAQRLPTTPVLMGHGERIVLGEGA